MEERPDWVDSSSVKRRAVDSFVIDGRCDTTSRVEIPVIVVLVTDEYVLVLLTLPLWFVDFYDMGKICLYCRSD